MQITAADSEVHAGRTPVRSNLAGVKLLGRKNDDGEGEAESTAASDQHIDASSSLTPPVTGPKGRPTPKRSESARRRGPVAPAPMTSAEARARRKSLAGPKLSRAERKVERTERRERMGERREKMMAGDEAYLLPRDQGPVRRYVRDLVDSRRNLLGLFMPAAVVLIFITLSMSSTQIAQSGLLSIAMLVLVVIMVLDGIWLARKVSDAVDVKFPDNTESRWKLGLYAAGRASQPRRMRAPRPLVKRGDDVS